MIIYRTVRNTRGHGWCLLYGHDTVHEVALWPVRGIFKASSRPNYLFGQGKKSPFFRGR